MLLTLTCRVYECSIMFQTVNCICAPAVQVNRRGLTPQIWNTEKFEYNLSEMRKIYQRWKISENKVGYLTLRTREKQTTFVLLIF